MSKQSPIPENHPAEAIERWMKKYCVKSLMRMEPVGEHAKFILDYTLPSTAYNLPKPGDISRASQLLIKYRASPDHMAEAVKASIPAGSFSIAKRAEGESAEPFKAEPSTHIEMLATEEQLRGLMRSLTVKALSITDEQRSR